MCTLAGLLLMDLYYFSISRSESRYIELIIEHILVQLLSGEFSFFSWLVLFRYAGWYCLYFSILYMWFCHHAWLYIHICVLSCSLLTEEISLFVSICLPSSRPCTPYFGKRGVIVSVPIRNKFIITLRVQGLYLTSNF